MQEQPRSRPPPGADVSPWCAVSHRPRSRAVVLIDDADRLPDPVLTATAMRMPGCLVVAVCRDHVELAEVADVVIVAPRQR